MPDIFSKTPEVAFANFVHEMLWLPKEQVIVAALFCSSGIEVRAEESAVSVVYVNHLPVSKDRHACCIDAKLHITAKL